MLLHGWFSFASFLNALRSLPLLKQNQPSHPICPTCPFFGSFGQRGALAGGASNSIPLFLLTLAFVPLAVMQNRADWQRIIEGRKGSTYCRGIPRYAARFNIQGDFAARWIDPLICLVLALVAYSFSPLLGLWMLLAGFALAIFEQVSQERYLNNFLDMLDGKYYAERMQEEVEAVTTGVAGERPAYDGVIPSLPPIMLKDMAARQEEFRRRRQRPPRPDDDKAAAASA